jgi:hypothetical protein
MKTSLNSLVLDTNKLELPLYKAANSSFMYKIPLMWSGINRAWLCENAKEIASLKFQGLNGEGKGRQKGLLPHLIHTVAGKAQPWPRA